MSSARPDNAQHPGSSGRTSFRDVLALVSIPNYRRFVGGQSISLIGSWTETIAQALLILQLTHSATVLGLVVATRYLPVLLGTPYAGLIVDRTSKRRMLMLTSTVLGLTSLAVGALMIRPAITTNSILANVGLRCMRRSPRPSWSARPASASSPQATPPFSWPRLRRCADG